MAEIRSIAARNRHPADELADVRKEIRRLQDVEVGLRHLLLSGECGLEGDEHVAQIKTRTSEKLDAAAVKREFGLERLRPFIVRQAITQVRLEKKSSGAA